MSHPLYKVFNVKTGEVFTCSHARMQIAKRHGFDKDWEVIPLHGLSATPPTPPAEPKPTVEVTEGTTIINVDIPKKRKYKKKTQ